MRAPRFPFPTLAPLAALILCAVLFWPCCPNADAAPLSGSAAEKGHAAQAPVKAGPKENKKPSAPLNSENAAAAKAFPPPVLRLEPITEVEMRRIPASLPWAAAYAHARATAWLTAVRKAADKLPQQRAISMGAVTPAERRALAAQLYTAGAPPPNPEKPNPLHAVVTLQPRSQAERQIRVALRNAELLELRQRLMEETRAT